MGRTRQGARPWGVDGRGGHKQHAPVSPLAFVRGILAYPVSVKLTQAKPPDATACVEFITASASVEYSCTWDSVKLTQARHKVPGTRRHSIPFSPEPSLGSPNHSTSGGKDQMHKSEAWPL